APAIVQLTAAARAEGVREGMTPSQAMARCDHLLCQARSPLQAQAATDVLLQTAYAFSPRIEATQPGICTLDLQGLALAPDQATMESWAAKIIQALAQFHLAAKVGIAVTPALALLAARSGPPSRWVVDPAEFVSRLPIAA